MATAKQIRDGLTATLAPIANLNQQAYLLSNITPPAAEIETSTVEYDAAGSGGGDWWNFTVRVYVGATTDIGAQMLLDTFMNPTGATSVKQAIETDRSLGGVVDSLHVTGCTGARRYDRGSVALLGAEWQVRVLASR